MNIEDMQNFKLNNEFKFQSLSPDISVSKKNYIISKIDSNSPIKSDLNQAFYQPDKYLTINPDIIVGKNNYNYLRSFNKRA